MRLDINGFFGIGVVVVASGFDENGDRIGLFHGILLSFWCIVYDFCNIDRVIFALFADAEKG